MPGMWMISEEIPSLRDAIHSLMRHLDPHSEYLDPEEVKRLNETREGQFTEDRDRVSIEKDTLNILRFCRAVRRRKAWCQAIRS